MTASSTRLWRLGRRIHRSLPAPVQQGLRPAVRTLAGVSHPVESLPDPAGASGSSRLVPSPVFVICSVRSGSTLLRVLLNSHPLVHAPHELHLRTLRVELEKEYTELAMQALGLDREELEHLLWDRVLHLELQQSGKQVVVDKTPGNVFTWRRIQRCWPQARYIFLLRHPAAMVESLLRGRPTRDPDETIDEIHGYATRVEEARQALPGLTVRYEDLAADPRTVTGQVCDFLGVAWEERMLKYGKQDHGGFRVGIGDWGRKIHSGKVKKARPLPDPDEVPSKLRDLTRAWGYLSQER